MTKKEQLKVLVEQAKAKPNANLNKLIRAAINSGKLSATDQKKVWSKVETVAKKLQQAEKSAEAESKKSIAKKAATKPKAKKSAPKAKAKKPGKRGPKNAGETFFGRARMIRDANPSLTWKEAQTEAKKYFANEKSKKAKAVQSALKSFPNFAKATKDTSNVQKDANQPAKPPGKRKSRKGAKREFYWESRSNRSDLKQPPKNFPMLEKGGLITKEKFDRYVKVQRQGDYNMLTQSDLARGMANLTKEEYFDIINNYRKYQSQFYPNKMAYGGRLSFQDKAKNHDHLGGKSILDLQRELEQVDQDIYFNWYDPGEVAITYGYQDEGDAMPTQVRDELGFVLQGGDFGSPDVRFYPSEMRGDKLVAVWDEWDDEFSKGGSVSGFDEDGFPEGITVSGPLRARVRRDAQFAQEVMAAIRKTMTMDESEAREAQAILRGAGVEMDYDMDGSPTSLKIMAKGGRLSKFDKLANKVAKNYEGKKVPAKFRKDYGATYDAEEAREVGDKVAAKVYRLQKKAGKFSEGGKVYRMMKQGGEVIVKDIFKGRDFSESAYPAFFSDFDRDGVPNADDAAPLNPEKKGEIEGGKGQSFVKSFRKLNQMRKEFDDNMYSFIDELKPVAPNGAVIYARTKSPSSIVKKLIDKRLEDKKGRGLTDVIGTMMVVNNRKQVDGVRDEFLSGKFGEVVDFDDFYSTPQAGYRAYHFIVNHNGKPVEIQVKTKRQKQINELSHAPYKAGRVNVPLLQTHSKLADDADKGDKGAIREFKSIFTKDVPKDIYFLQ